MSRRYWIAVAAIGLTLSAAAILLAGYSVSKYQSENRQIRAEAASEYTGSGDHHFRSTCRIIPLRLSLECVSEQQGGGDEQAAAIGGLKAQQEMSAWTLGMLWISGFMLLTTIAGLYIVARTLRATRDALISAERAADAAEVTARDAREIGKKQVRAYLTVDKMVAEMTERGPCFSILIQNSGNSPARKVHCRITATLMNGPKAADHKTTHFVVDVPAIPSNSAISEKRRILSDMCMERLEAGQIAVWVVQGCVYWLDAFEDVGALVELAPRLRVEPVQPRERGKVINLKKVGWVFCNRT